MVVVSKASGAPGMALFYITTGALMTIWAAVWYLAFAPESRVSIGICAGLFLSGLAFLVIGFSLGRIGRQAREAEMAPRTDEGSGGGQPPVQNVQKV